MDRRRRLCPFAPEPSGLDGALSDEEWELMRGHTIAGAQMLGEIGGLLGEVGSVVRSHHERFDGGGYPDGLSGGEIPIAARIIAVRDAFHAMTSHRPYREAMSVPVALAELRSEAGAPNSIRASA